MNLLRAPDAPSKWRTLIAACLGLGMLMIDMFVVNVALPAIGRDLDADLATVEWTITGYVLMLAVLPVAAGRLGDIFGRRRVYLLGLVIFIVGSGAAGLAQSVEQLIAFRVVQGTGAAIMMPGTLALITQAFPAAQRSLAIGIWGGVSGLALISGPILGGLLVTGDTWQWIFIVNLPVGAVALLMTLWFVPESRDQTAPRSIDWPGIVLLAGGLFLVVFGISRANAEGWTSVLILSVFASGATALVLFVEAERRVRYPLVDLALFRSRAFVMAGVSAFLFSFAVFGSQPFFSLLMQHTWGFSALEGGLAFLPGVMLVAIFLTLGGPISQRLGRRVHWAIIGGSVLVTVSAFYLLLLDSDDRYVGGLLPALLVRGPGIGLVMTATAIVAMRSLPDEKSGLASGTLTMARQVGTAVGVAVMGAVYLQHVDGALAVGLADLSVAELEGVMSAADQFRPFGTGAVRETAERAIVGGFVQIAVVGAIASSFAALAAFFIRSSDPGTAARQIREASVLDVRAEPFIVAK